MTEQVKKVELKEGFNKATVVGTLVEKNLEETSYTKQDGTKVEQIKGSISIRTGEHEVHQVRLQTNKFTNAGKENGFFKGYQTIKNEYISVADVADNPELVATQLKVDGKITTNEYYGQDGQLKQYQQIEGTFVNRLTDKDDATPRAVYETEVFVAKTRPEMKDGEETGRALVDAYIPTYSGIVPYKFAVIEQGADFFLSEVKKGQTIKLYGQILNKKEEHVKFVPAAFGDDIREVTYSYVTESLILNAALPYDEESPKAFKAEQVNERLVKREVYLETQKNRGQQTASQQPPMASFGGGTSTEPKKADIPVDVSKLF
jgi:hypothetical protein